ncbi:hypothetical protein [Actinocorallia aurea]
MSAERGPGPFSLVIEGSGRVNDIEFTASGRGEGDTLTGDLEFEVAFSDVSAHTDPFANLLAVLILPTGLFGREGENAANLLTISGGDFFFRQILSGPNIAAQSSGRLDRTGPREFTWTSFAEGQVELAEVTEIQPFNVVMIPAGPGGMIETAEWPIVDDGQVKRVHAIRDFTFDPTAGLAGHQLRHVQIESASDGLALRLRIQSTIRRLQTPALHRP